MSHWEAAAWPLVGISSPERSLPISGDLPSEIGLSFYMTRVGEEIIFLLIQKDGSI